jgi:hypothetical protein
MIRSRRGSAPHGRRRPGIAFPGSFDPPTTAHLAIARAAHERLGGAPVTWIVSVAPLGKDAPATPRLAERVAVLRRAAAEHAWLDVSVTDSQLIVDIARGFEAVVIGADKWHQVLDPTWYGDDPRACDRAIAALPRVLVVPRGHDHSPLALRRPAEELTIDPALALVSSTRARAGERDLMLPPARAYDDSTGAWSSPRHPRR